MPRLNVVTPAQAMGKTRELFDLVHQAVGAVPNIYQGIGNSAEALGAALQIGHALKHGSLTDAEVEAIKLVVSEAYGCNYCLAAHSLLGKKAGLAEPDLLRVRRGTSQDPKLAALLKFISAAIHPAARISDGQLRAVKDAGYTDAQITESLLAVAHVVFTNLFNRVHQTTLDFPAARSL